MRLLLNLALITIIGTGCTSALHNSARGKQVSVENESQLLLDVVSAKILHNFDESSTRLLSQQIHICLKKTKLPNSISYHTVDIDYPKYSTPSSFFRNRDGVLVYSVMSVESGCNVEKRHLHSQNQQSETIAVLRVSEDKPLKLDNQFPQAIYVSLEKDTIKTLGFASMYPFFTSKHSFNIDLSQSSIYSEYKQQKPYLLLLTPLTAIADGVAGAVFFGVMGVSCNLQPNGCQ